MIILPRNSGTLAELELARSVVDPEMISSRSGQVKKLITFYADVDGGELKFIFSGDEAQVLQVNSKLIT